MFLIIFLYLHLKKYFEQATCCSLSAKRNPRQISRFQITDLILVVIVSGVKFEPKISSNEVVFSQLMFSRTVTIVGNMITFAYSIVSPLNMP